ncbi:unnamed protein product [Trichobilharzia regenti]|nr:unnamed protein product [Trichobilharzia regenti]
MTVSTPVGISSNQYEKSHSSGSDQDDLHHSNNNDDDDDEMIADDVVTPLGDKTLNPLHSLEAAAPCMDDLHTGRLDIFCCFFCLCLQNEKLCSGSI